jgi:hypothetical protein
MACRGTGIHSLGLPGVKNQAADLSSFEGKALPTLGGQAGCDEEVSPKQTPER